MVLTKLIKGFLAAAVVAAASPALAQSFEGCPSGPILEKFVEFGKTGQMPPELRKWLGSKHRSRQSVYSQTYERGTALQ
ncbi:hypothetical protein SADFL11_3682 [Roseibium alexandrii DFL-11]|uniref:Uncharacterized protein n=1 Tax=Roseibium alexandrii (strain DSM 17067 / NCIMB 14079 / DFL-11) TaxID=244592 RepID=A0A5E8H208_ROSAD|nr:hypothetical protein SADFL11_3682 [Roseibium alexandrii DFL-11]